MNRLSFIATTVLAATLIEGVYILFIDYNTYGQAPIYVRKLFAQK